MSEVIDEGNPKDLLDWLVRQHTCEWCNGTVEAHDEMNRSITPKAKWMCRIEKRNGYVIRHWKNWLICWKCAADHIAFIKWIFPTLASIVPESFGLATLLNVQPMCAPAADIIYADYIPRVRETPEDRVVLDDDGFRDAIQDKVVVDRLERFARTFAERPLRLELYAQATVPINHIQIDYKITDKGAERTVTAPSGVVKT